MELRETSFAEKIGQRISIILIFLAGFILLTLFFQKLGVLNPANMRSFVEGTGHWAPIVLIILTVIGSISMTLPATPAIVLLGALYGPVLGSIYAFIAVLIGASIAFFVARYFRKYILLLLGEHAEILVRFQEKYVAGVVLFTRAIPFFSFEIISYASGLTGIPYTHYILATAIGVIIPIILYTTTGSFILETGGNWLPSILAMVMIIMIFVIPLAIEHYNPFGWKEKLLKPKHHTK